MKKHTIIISTLLIILSTLVFAPQAHAVGFDRGERVRLDFQGQNETRVITGNTVELTGELDGDVYVFAENLISKAVINGDLIGAVGSGLIEGSISGNIRMAASSLTINGSANNATLAAGTLTFGSESKLNDLFVVSQRSEFKGSSRTIHSLGQQVTLAGSTTEQVTINAEQIFIDPKASIEGNFNVTSKQKPEQFDTISVGGTRAFSPLTHKKRVDPMNGVIKLFWVLVMVYVVRSIASLKSTVTSFVPSARSFLVPLISLILVPIAAILLAFTLIGLPLAGFLGLLWVIGLILAKPLFALFAAEYISHQKNWNIHLSILLTAVVIAILTHLPFLGSLISLAIFIFGWALVYHTLKELVKSKNES